MIDLRSDTASKPTPAMREAIAKAQVGDEQLREDPTVNELERLAAQTLGPGRLGVRPDGDDGERDRASRAR